MTRKLESMSLLGKIVVDPKVPKGVAFAVNLIDDPPEPPRLSVVKVITGLK